MTFQQTGLSADILRAVSEAGYDTPTPIQASSIPPILNGRDMIGIAQTGTGKTAAFTLPIIDMLAKGRARARMARALILSPTRELAMQTAENFKRYGIYHRLAHILLIGGVSMEEQFRLIARGTDVLIATPGRLLDHFERGKLLLSGIEIFVIDEADRMLDMGFIPDIERIVRLLPAKRQTLLFSATMPAPIEKLAQQFMRDPQHIAAAASGTTADKINQLLIWTDEHNKMNLLLKHLRRAEGNAIVFCNRKRDVDRVCRILARSKIQAEALHGDMAQFRRIEVLEKFRAQQIPVLIASNVAARGLDIADIAHVVNFDVPQHAEDYVHRIGRTGRAGRSGDALTLATEEEEDFVKAISDLIGGDIPQRRDHAKQEPRATQRTAGQENKKPRANNRPHRPNRPKRRRRGRGGDDDGSHLPAFLLAKRS